MEKEKFEKKVVHVIFKGETREKDKHAYFGSVACIFDHYTDKQVGITYGTLRNIGLSETKPYENDKVIILKGKLLTKDRKEKTLDKEN